MSSSILDSLPRADADRVLAAGTRVTLPAGWSPISERTPADKAYLLTAGEVSVRRGGEEVARLGPGDIVGEAAIVHHTLRSASVVALTPLEAVHFTSEALERLIDQVPGFGTALREAAASRLGTGGPGGSGE